LSIRINSGAPPLGDETLQGRNHVVPSDRPVDIHRQCFTGVFINDVQQLQTSQISGFVELEIKTPHMIAMGGSQEGAIEAARPTFLVLRWWRTP
jgi:hypothetical protein